MMPIREAEDDYDEPRRQRQLGHEERDTLHHQAGDEGDLA
jgi:hypothetical protein